MSRCHDNFHALVVQFRDDLFRSVAGVAKLDIRAGSRSYFCFGQRESEDSDLHAAKLAHHIALGPAERLARCRVDDVRGGPAKLRLTNTLLQHVWAKVTLMVAVRRGIQADGVPCLDHLLA